MVSTRSLQPPLGTSGLSTTDNMSSPLHRPTSSSYVKKPFAFPNVVPMGKQKSRRQFPNDPVVPTGNRLSRRILNHPIAPMDTQQSRRQIPNNPVAPTGNQLSHRPISNNPIAPMDTQQSRQTIPEIPFRVLIMGRANAGKTSILQRICDTIESPGIYRGDKKVRGPTFLSAPLISPPTRLNLTHQWMLVTMVLLFGFF